MNEPTVLLIVDEVDADRHALERALTGRVNTIHSVATPGEAWTLAQGLDHVSGMVAAIPATHGETLFQLKDDLKAKFGAVPSAICSASDMSAYYSRVQGGDKLFYKPVEMAVLQDWITSTIGPPLLLDATAPITPPAMETPESSQPPQGVSGEGITAYDNDLPVGTQLGDYRLERLIQRDQDFALYEAEQTSINRKVAIKTLYRRHRRDPVWVQAFVSEASARARVNHPNVSLVYECVQEQGVNFYTLELVDAPSLADIAAQRKSLSDDTLWGILEACTSALEYFRTNQMEHRIITAQSILLQNETQTRIANPVKGIGNPLSPEEENQQMQYLASALRPFIKKGMTDASLYSLIDRMGQERIDGIKTIDGLRRGLNDDSAAKTSALSRSRTTTPTKEETNRKAIVTGSMIGIALIIGGILASLLLRGAPETRVFDQFSKIPEGPFPYQDGEMKEVPEFWMAQQEVTIGQYAEFLADIEGKPTTLEGLRHPDQPEDKTSHEPLKWSAMWEAAKKGKNFLNGRITPNCPVTGVDWWDAYAYARWKNARLPTEMEWEKAARGRSGMVYPWGDELDYSRFNSGIDQKDKDDQKAGSVDGFEFWAEVDDLNSDMSRYGVTGMAGNVSEWTATWDSHPDNPDKLVPIKRGASFATSEGFESTSRRAAEMAEERNYFTGFRIVSDIEPGTDPDYTPPAPERIGSMTPASGSTPRGGKGPGKGKGATSGETAPAPPAMTEQEWDPADGPDPFETIFASPAKD